MRNPFISSVQKLTRPISRFSRAATIQASRRAAA
jgi:hypothetical protein